MRVLIYDGQTGAAIREIETSILEDATFGLNPDHGAIELVGELTVDEVYVVGDEVRLKTELPGTVVEVDGLATFSDLLEGIYVWVDGQFVGKTDGDGTFELTHSASTPIEVTMRHREHTYSIKKWTVNA